LNGIKELGFMMQITWSKQRMDFVLSKC